MALLKDTVIQGDLRVTGTIYGADSPLYGACSTAAATAAKTVTITNFPGLITGVTVKVKFTNSNTVASPTLNVNDTGAKAIMRYGTTAVSTSAATSWRAGAVVSLTYDGTNWVENTGIDNNTTYSSQAAASGGTAVSLVTTGEKYTWNNKIGSIDGIAGATATRYATCATAAATAAKTASVTAGTFSLATGSVVFVKFTYSNTVASPTLDINSTGAKSIMRYGTTAVSTSAATSWRAGAVVGFVYDGTNWVMMTGIDDNTTYTIKQDGITGATVNRYGTCATAAATAAKVASITTGTFSLETGATVYIKFTYSNTVASPTLNVNSTGAKSIMRYGTTAVSTSAATSWQAGAVVGFTYDGTNWVMHDWLNNNTTTGTTYAAASVPNNTTFATQGSVYNVYNATKHSTTTASLAVASWSNKQITVSVSNVTASNTVIVSPAPDSVSAWAAAGVYCSAQAAGTLTFTCTTTPTVALTANVIVMT